MAGQKVLDLGTGTGVLPRNMYRYGAEWVGCDISPEQIEQAKALFREGIMPKLADVLKPNGYLLILYMAWLPYEDRIAGASEELVLKYSPKWSGAGETRHPIWIPDITYDYFVMEDHEEYDLMVPFTKESWHGRMKACRGVGASLSEAELGKWDAEHRELLDRIAPEKFDIMHYAALAVLKKK